MANSTKADFLLKLAVRFGTLNKLPYSESLFQLRGYDVRLYIRYSKVHPGRRTVFGLRETDLRQLQGFESFIVFIWDDQAEPLFLPFRDYQELFQEAIPAADGQYKVQVLQAGGEAPELYVARLGRFNVSAHIGWEQFAEGLAKTTGIGLPALSHSQVQTLLGAIGVANGHDVWIPVNDRARLDWGLTREYESRIAAPVGFKGVDHIVAEIDVLWLSEVQMSPRPRSKWSTRQPSIRDSCDLMISTWFCRPFLQHSALSPMMYDAPVSRGSFKGQHFKSQG